MQAQWKRIWRFFKKLKIQLPYDTVILLLGIYLEKMKTLFQKDTCAPMFTAAWFTKAKTWKQLYVPQQRNGERSCVCVCVSTYLYQYIMEYHSAIKKNETMLIAATWMDLEITILSEVSQTEKDKYHMISHMQSLNKWYKWTYLQKRNRLTDRKPIDSYQRRKVRERWIRSLGLTHTYCACMNSHLCLRLCNPMVVKSQTALPGSSVHGIF